MRLLLDTHIAVWLTNTPERLSNQLRAAIEDPANQVAVSVVAVWEIAIKRALGSSDAPPLSAHQAVNEFAAADFHMLDVTASHAAFVERLPLIHADPFDRMMISQAIIENMQFVTYDRQLARYDVAMLTW